MIEQRFQRTYEGKSFAYYVDPMDDRSYSKIIGGIAWPEKEHGYLVVLGRERKTINGKYVLRTLFELECPTIPKLFKGCMVARPFYCVGRFYGDAKNRPMQSLWANLNEDKTSTDQIWICEAPSIREKEVNWRPYVESIMTVLSEPKRLFLDNCNKLKAKIAELPDDVGSKHSEDFPAVTALAYAVMAMELVE